MNRHPAGRSWHIVPTASHPAVTRNACVGRVRMAEHPVESASFGRVSTAKQATFQVAPRRVGPHKAFCNREDMIVISWSLFISYSNFFRTEEAFALPIPTILPRVSKMQAQNRDLTFPLKMARSSICLPGTRDKRLLC